MASSSKFSIIGGAAALASLVACGPSAPQAAAPAAGAEGASEASGHATPAPSTSKATAHADPSLLPRKLLFGNPDRRTPKLSPSGRYLAWLAPKDGVMNVYVAARGDLASARAVTSEKNRPIPDFDWAYDNRHILYSLDEDGDEDVHVFSADIETSARLDLTPLDKTRALILKLSARVPGSVLLAINDRDPQFHDAYRVDLASGKRELVQKKRGLLGLRGRRGAHAALRAEAAAGWRF